MAKFKAWDSKAGAYVWRQRSTHLGDRGAALEAARLLEAAAGGLQRGTMTREKALALVEDLLALGGGGGLLPRRLKMGELVLEWGLAHGGRGGKVRVLAEVVSGLAWDFGQGEAQGVWDGLVGRGYSRGYLNQIWQLLGSVLEWGLARGLVQRDPRASVRRGRKEGGAKLVRLPFTRAEVARVCWTMWRAGARDWVRLALLGWHTGHRLGDLMALEKKNVERRGDLWCVVFSQRKTAGSGGRTLVLPVPGRVARMVGRQFRGKVSNGSTQFVGWLDRAGVSSQIITSGKRVLRNKSFHSFRHAMASRLSGAGVSDAVARLVTGHASEGARRTYVHTEVESIAKALGLK